MAAVEMSKLNLVAMAYDRDKILNALQHTHAAEIKLHSRTENTHGLEADCDGLRARLSEAEAALDILTQRAAAYLKKIKEKADFSDNVEISYSEFMSAGDRREVAESFIAQINALAEKERELNSLLSKTARTIDAAKLYSSYTSPLHSTKTAHTFGRLGALSVPAYEVFKREMEEIPLSCYDTVAEEKDGILVKITAHNSAAEQVDGVLSLAGFSPCPFDDDRSGEQLYANLLTEREQILGELEGTGAEWLKLSENLRELKIYCDRLAFELEKAELSDKLLSTATTFLLEAYVPAEQQDSVKSALLGVSSAVYFEFSAPAEDEIPPTLLKNNKVVQNFEAITNMYSPPSSRELDPNTVMAFFYSIFLGFIMADMGYGLMMILGGVFIKLRSGSKQSMIGSLGGVFAVGGIFTVIWGFLFNSFFGFALLPFKVMPDLQGAEMSWSLAGIKVPALLIISMLIGVVQLFAGYLCRAVQCWRRGKIADGIFDGVVWALFSVGVELAIVGFVEEFGLPVFRLVGGATAGASLLVAILTAGRKEKLLGKFTKGFGSAYGVINYASDILSYARLYGLMLAGAVIADIITSNSVSLISSGNGAFIILGILIMVIGHVFNLAIGLLGAYIHDARLQYVEFYGRFFEGEGKLFTPLGSRQKHVFVTD